MTYANLAWATCAPVLCRTIFLAVIVRSIKTLALSRKYLKTVEFGYTQLPADVLQLKSRKKFIMKRQTRAC